MYLGQVRNLPNVCTCYVLSTYLTLKVHTFQVTYPVHTKYTWCCTAFLSFLKSSSMYILTLAGYILWVPDSIVHLPGPASLLASDAGTSPHIEPKHTEALAGLFTAAWQHLCLHARQFAGLQQVGFKFTLLAAIMISCLLTSSTNPSQLCSVCCKWACEGLGL